MPDTKVGVSARSELPSLTTSALSVASVETPLLAEPVIVIRNELLLVFFHVPALFLKVKLLAMVQPSAPPVSSSPEEVMLRLRESPPGLLTSRV